MLVIADLLGASPAAWRRATARQPWTVDVPSLPGRDGEPAPMGGNYDLVTTGYAMARFVADRPGRRWNIVVGVGMSGWSASVAVFAGYADALALVDGLGDPWLTPSDRSDRQRDRFRAIEADVAALTPHHGGGTDPRLRHGVESHGSRSLALEAAAATQVPTLILSTDQQIGDPAVVAAYPRATALSGIDCEPSAVIDEIVEWWDAGSVIAG